MLAINTNSRRFEMNKRIIYLTLISVVLFLSCRKDDLIIEGEDDATAELEQPEIADWTTETHTELLTPNYDMVFKQDEVIRFDIKINSDDWATMQADLQANISSSSGGRGPGGGTTISEFDPVWVPCSFYYNDTEWYKVGIRYKGNSSLSSAVQSGVDKLSFKLDFDQFEDDYPVIENQRFYGFKQLNLKNNYADASLMREKVAADLFRNFGLVSSQVSFCVVYVDFGEGSQYFGVYSLVEEVDDTVIESQYEAGGGNLYKPDGDAASFASGTYDDSEMEKKNNEDLADYTDVKTLYTIINSTDRSSDYGQWKTNLEASLDVDIFLKWLAANTVIQNWDTYGIMTHNYYLYNNPLTGKLNWIPWDNNEAFQEGKQGGALSFSMNEVGNNWPLISYLMDDEEYESIYKQYLKQFTEEVFNSELLTGVYDSYYTLLKDYAYAEEANYTFLRYSTEFDNAVEALKTHVTDRVSAVNAYVN